jgi:hypothetical protein
LLALSWIILDLGNLRECTTFSALVLGADNPNRKEETPMRMIGKKMTAVLVGAAALAVTAVASFAASEFEGTWKVKDTSGTAFEITLTADGKASANRAGEGMSGTWKDEGGVAVISWKDGWTTKIAKEGDAYKKTAYKGDTGGEPTNTSDAEKVK